MNNELIIKKCLSCGAMIKILEDCQCDNCGIKCCGETMKTLNPNSVDAAIEKHIPNYIVKDNEIEVEVNHVMEDEHFIEWICLVSEKEERTMNFKPGESAKVHFPYIKGATLYAYCNKHGLWKNNID